MRILIALLALLSTTALAQAASYETVFFRSGGLKLEGYLFRPEGKGPFPAIVYSHGSREGEEREERPMAAIAEPFVQAGYVVLVPERRGYGKSEGATFSQVVRGERGARYVARAEAEANDVLAATAWLRRQSYVQKKRVALLGWSLGGSVTVMAASRGDYCAAVDQAPAAMSWKSSPEMQVALKKAAGRMRVPLLSMVAENDAGTDSALAVDSAVPAATPHDRIIYPTFHPATPRAGIPDGHLLFGPASGGIGRWKDDVLRWLAQHCAAR